MKLFNRHLMRNLEATSLLELFFVIAVFSVLGIRFFLALTGYPIPQPGQSAYRPRPFGWCAHDDRPGHCSRLHQQVCLLSGGRPGGFGFGAFIDELGKFITGDNDYFYRPTVALIYVVFILLYLVIENFVNKPRLSEQEKLINVLEMAKEVVLEDLDHRERRRALDLLKECSPSDPVTKALRELLYATQSVPVPKARYLHCCQVSRQKDLPEAGAKNLVCKGSDCLLHPAIALRPGSGLLFALC